MDVLKVAFLPSENSFLLLKLIRTASTQLFSLGPHSLKALKNKHSLVDRTTVFSISAKSVTGDITNTHSELRYWPLACSVSSALSKRSRLRVWLCFYQHLQKVEELNTFKIPPEMQVISNAQSSTWSITQMVWAFIKIVHAWWSNIVLRENRQWLIRHPKPRSGVRQIFHISGGCILWYRLHFSNKTFVPKQTWSLGSL